MLNVPVVMVLAAAAVLAGVVAVALGRGGELFFFQADYAPLRLEKVTATDVVLFRPPLAVWGYNAQATDEALNRIAEALTERDIEIAALRQQVADLEAAGPASRRRARDRLEPRGSRAGDLPPGAGARDAGASGKPPGRAIPPARAPEASGGARQDADPEPGDLSFGFGPRHAAGRSADARDADRFGLGDAAKKPQGDPDAPASAGPGADPHEAAEERGW
jgi:hypothetical protein